MKNVDSGYLNVNLFKMMKLIFDAPRLAEKLYLEKRSVDDYVEGLLRKIKVSDPINPTKDERLNAALKMDEDGSPFLGIEIMLGRRIKEGELYGTYTYLAMGGYERDKVKFFKGIPNDYQPLSELDFKELSDLFNE